MRDPDIVIDGQTRIYHVPIERLQEWARTHPERMHQASREQRFTRIWRDLWYLSVPISGGDIDDEIAERAWFAVSLRDLRQAPPEWPRFYREAEWELCAEEIDEEPEVNGNGMYDQMDQPPTFLYQFHGLPESRVLDVGNGESFAIFGWQVLARGRRPIGEVCALLSMQVNALRMMDGLEGLKIASGDPLLVALGEIPNAGLLCELDDGSPVTEMAVRS